MPKVHFISDLHIGNHRRHGGAEAGGINERCRETLDVLEEAVESIPAGDFLVVLGDVFDSPRPSPQVIAATMEAFSRCPAAGIFLLVGNHDRRSDAHGDHALAPFDYLDRVTVVERAASVHLGGHTGLVLVPYLAGQTAETLIGEIRAAAGALDIEKTLAIGLHAGLIYPGAPPWAQTARSAIPVQDVRELANDVGADLVVSGDWHTHRRFDGGCLPPAYQCGALVPTGWDNPGVEGYGKVGTWHADTTPTGLTFRTVPGPRFLRAGADKAREVIQGAAGLGHSPRVRVDALDEEEAARAGAILGVVEVHRADVDPKQEAARAAQAARSSKTIDGAIAAYCREMPLPEGVKHDVVADAVRRYLAGATDEG